MNPAKTIQRQFRRVNPNRPGKRFRLRNLIATVGIGALALAALSFVPSLILSTTGLQRVDIPPLTSGVKIFDLHDRTVCTIYGEKDQEPIPLNKISDNLKHAVIAAEDHDFYGHDGINFFSVVRAIMVDVAAGHPVQGGSTISQQLVKNLYFEGKKRNIADKFQEAFMAIDMEKRYSKETILEGYLNHVYFGNGVYGAQRASEYYFAKKPDNLNIAESCYLAALVNRPSELSLIQNRPKAIARQQMILDSMQQLRFASDKEVQYAKKSKLAFHSTIGAVQKYRYYTSEVLQLCRDELGDQNLFQRGIHVYTNLDPAAQALAEKTLANGIKHAPHGINQGALVSISVKDGGVVAMVGGAGNYANNQWNRSLSPHTAGSAFKPFVYLAALAKGVLSPDALVADAPLEIREAGAPVYRPRNFDGQYLGDITIRKALALSRNTCAVRVALQVGPSEVVRVAQAAGITSKLDPNLSLALGSSAVTPLEMANSYATLARNGEYLQPLLIRRITDAKGHTIKEFTQSRLQVFDAEPVAEVVDALQDVVQKGTGTGAQLFDRPVAGKTGTSDAAKDIWFVGFTPDLVTAVWGGNDQNRAVRGHVSGGSVMAGIWQSYMREYYRQHVVAAGSFVAPLHPLLQENEPLHMMPAPAGIFDRLFGAFEDKPPIVREYRWDNQDPRTAPDSAISAGAKYGPGISGSGPSSAPQLPPPRKKRSLIKKIFNWLDM